MQPITCSRLRTSPHFLRTGAHFATHTRSSRTIVRCGASEARQGPSFPSAPVRLAALAVTAVQRVKSAALEAAKSAAEADVNAQIRGNVAQMRALALVAPFAAVSGGADTFLIITKAVASFIKLYLLLLFVRVLLSWFPTFTWWEQQPWLALRQVTDPYLKLFSGLVPPLLGTIDLTPLFGFFILQFLAGALDVADDETRFWS
jgi:YggT family protein